MGRWLVTQGGTQFGADDLGELKQLAASGALQASDMVQPPGATDWVYASEIPELSPLFSDEGAEDDDDLDYRRPGLGGVLGGGAVAALLLAILVVFGGLMLWYYGKLPTGQERLVGEGGLLTYSEMIVIEPDAPLHAGPGATSQRLGQLDKDEVIKLKAKRGDFYRIQTHEGTEGWVHVEQVIPMYLLGGGEVRREHDPLYNPDRYVSVKNASWLQLDEANVQLTVFQFWLYNESEYDMTDLVLQASIKDSRGNLLEHVDIPVEGIIPSKGATMVGTLEPEDGEVAVKRLLTKHTFDELARRDPDVALIYKDGVEVEMRSADFTEATIDIVELRAVPNDP